MDNVIKHRKKLGRDYFDKLQHNRIGKYHRKYNIQKIDPNFKWGESLNYRLPRPFEIANIGKLFFDEIELCFTPEFGESLPKFRYSPDSPALNDLLFCDVQFYREKYKLEEIESEDLVPSNLKNTEAWEELFMGTYE